MNTETKGYRFKIPVMGGTCETYSFGIEPYKENKYRQIKAGKAVVRIIMYRVVPHVREYAEMIAQKIVDNLSAGRMYTGPKVLHLDKAGKYPAEKINDYFLDRLADWGVQ